MSAFREGLLDWKDRSYGLNPLTCGCKLAIIGWTIAETDWKTLSYPSCREQYER